MPQDPIIAELTEQFAALQAQVDALENDKQLLEKDKAKMQARIDHLVAQLNLSKSQRFGKKSEKSPRGTFNEAEQIKAAPKHHKKGKQSLPSELEREEIEHALTDTSCVCCGHDMHICDSEDSEQVKIIPEKISVIKHKQFKYACRQCEHTEIKNKIITAGKPKQPIPGSMASSEALAAVVTAKYSDALPLYRQVEIFKRGGLTLSRSTLVTGA